MKIKYNITYKRTLINDGGRKKNFDTPWGNWWRWSGGGGWWNDGI
ncbi:hypothetical protein Hanom_Chr11g00995091 [Helianthus anomalus]